MKIVVMGTGGVGGYYGGLFARQGHEVFFVARGAHLQVIQDHGLQVYSVHGDFAINPVQAGEDPTQFGIADLVLFCTKTYDTEQAAKKLLPVIGEHTMVMSFQNGVDSAERIGAVLGHEHIVGSVTWISTMIEAPGVIRQLSLFRRVAFGELDGSQSARIQALCQAWNELGIDLECEPNIQKLIWTKFLFISAISGIGSLVRLSVGDYRSLPETRTYMASLMREVEAVARAQGISLASDIVAQTLAFIDQASPMLRPSMQVDVEAGRRTELDSMIGVICRKGRELGLPTPVADLVYALLLPVELKTHS